MQEKKVIVGIPCYNEELSIAKVIADFKMQLPQAEVFVVDNNSKDRTAQLAKEAGAKVFVEKKQGKGFAVQKLFEVFDGDILILVDGDDTYPAESVKKLLKPVWDEDVEMVVGNRIHKKNAKNFTQSHWLGNKFLTHALNFLFGTKLRDMESGFRVMDKKFVESSALLAGGFGIEPELTIQAIEKGMRIKEIPIEIRLRQKGSVSKLNAVRDGTIVLYTMISLFRDYKPLQFFVSISTIFLLIGAGLGWYSVRDYLYTGIVLHIPALIVSGFCVMTSLVSFIAGLILSSIKRRHEELLIILRRRNAKKK